MCRMLYTHKFCSADQATRRAHICAEYVYDIDVHFFILDLHSPCIVYRISCHIDICNYMDTSEICSHIYVTMQYMYVHMYIYILFINIYIYINTHINIYIYRYHT